MSIVCVLAFFRKDILPEIEFLLANFDAYCFVMPPYGVYSRWRSTPMHYAEEQCFNLMWRCRVMESFFVKKSYGFNKVSYEIFVFFDGENA